MSEDEDNVIIWRGVTRHDLPPERILNHAKDADLDRVVILGYDRDGQMYFASSFADGGDVMWLMELAKARLLKITGE